MGSVRNEDVARNRIKRLAEKTKKMQTNLSKLG